MPDPNSERVAAVFADAWALYGDAIDVLELGKPRLAAEGAWGAVKRATDAMILARTGREPGGTGQTSGGCGRSVRKTRRSRNCETVSGKRYAICMANAFTWEFAIRPNWLARLSALRRIISAMRSLWRNLRRGILRDGGTGSMFEGQKVAGMLPRRMGCTPKRLITWMRRTTLEPGAAAKVGGQNLGRRFAGY